MAYKAGYMAVRKFRYDSKLGFPFRNPNKRMLTSKPQAQKI
jgi:hypothetical protein